MLTVNQISKKYANQVLALQDINFEINSKELVSIAGPNGSGKTTLISCILGIIQPDSGEILLNGQKNGSVFFKRLIAYVPDDLLLIEPLTGYEYLDFINSMYEVDNLEKRDQLIELYSMDNAMNQPIETYSHGMKKKTQLIAAFMLNGKLLILDEPFRGLDIEAIIITKKLLRKFVDGGGSILLSTHDLLAADALSDRIIILSKGEKLAEGSSEALKSEFRCDDMEDVFMKVSSLGNRRERIEQIIRSI